MSLFDLKQKVCVAICTPMPARQGPHGLVYDTISPRWHRARNSLAMPTNFNTVELLADGMEVGDARSQIAARCLAHDPAPEFLFFIDYDVLLPPDALTKLFFRARTLPDYDIYAGVYCCKWHSPPDPLIYGEHGQGSIWDWAVGDLLTTESHGVKTVHMGLTLIRCSAFQKLKDAGLVHGDGTDQDDCPFFKTTEETRTVDPKSGAGLTKAGTEDIFFCHPFECLIMTGNGVKQIGEMTTDDVVLSHTGRWKRVLAHRSRHHIGTMRHIGVTGWKEPIKCTPEHPLMCLRYGRTVWLDAENIEVGDWVGMPEISDRDSGSATIQPADWIPVMPCARNDKKYLKEGYLKERVSEGWSANDMAAECGTTDPTIRNVLKSHNLVADHRGVGIVRALDRVKSRGATASLPVSVPVTEDVAWLLGLYLAEGHVSGVFTYLTVSRAESALQERINRALAEITERPAKMVEYDTITRFIISNKTLSELLVAFFGTGSKVKALPPCVFEWPKRLIRALLGGYLQGDGSIDHRIVSFATVSPHLATGFRALFALLGISIRFKLRKSRLAVIRGRTHTTSPLYIGSVPTQYGAEVAGWMGRTIPKAGHSGTVHTKETDRVWFQVREVEDVPFDGTVYNIEVEDDNSYTMPQGVAHNCDLLSKIGGKILVDTSVLAGHEDKRTGIVYGLPLDRHGPSGRAKWLHDEKGDRGDKKEAAANVEMCETCSGTGIGACPDVAEYVEIPKGCPRCNGTGKTKQPLKIALDIGAGGERRQWDGYVTYTTDIRADTKPDYVQDTRLLNLPADHFDRTASSHHLEHIGRWDQEQVWREMFRITIPGGDFEHIVPNIEWAAQKVVDKEVDGHVLNVLYGAQEAHGYARQFNLHYFGYTPEVAIALAEQAGFVDVTTESWKQSPALGYNLIIRGRKAHPDDPVPDEAPAEEAVEAPILEPEPTEV